MNDLEEAVVVHLFETIEVAEHVPLPYVVQRLNLRTDILVISYYGILVTAH